MLCMGGGGGRSQDSDPEEAIIQILYEEVSAHY